MLSPALTHMFDLVLSNIAKHVTLNQAEIDEFLTFLQPKTIKRKSALLSAGEICKAIYFVSVGCLRIYHTDENGTDHVSLFAPEDWWAGDMYSFHTKTPAFYSIDALEDTEVFQLTEQNLERLYQRIPKFERFFRILFQNGFIMYQQRITLSQSLTAEERYARFNELYPRLEQRIAQKHIASYLGITPVFLSMLRSRS